MENLCLYLEEGAVELLLVHLEAGNEGEGVGDVVPAGAPARHDSLLLWHEAVTLHRVVWAQVEHKTAHDGLEDEDDGDGDGDDDDNDNDDNDSDDAWQDFYFFFKSAKS